LIFIAWVLAYPCTAAPADSTSAAAFCKQGLRAMERDSLDKALEYFNAASLAGMSKDSLYYYMSSIYFAKGAYDTALAFNFGMMPASQDFAISRFQQRYAIFKALSWDYDAETLNDSLMKIPAYRQRYLIPQLSVRIGADYSNREETDQPEFPVGNAVMTRRYAGSGYAGKALVQWVAPLPGRFQCKAGFSGLFTSMYFRTSMANDSVNRSASAFAALEHSLSGLSLEYDIRRAVDFLGDYTTLNSISLNRSRTSKKWLSLFSIGYESELGPRYKRENQRFWAIGYANQAPIALRGWGFFLMGSYYDAPALGKYAVTNVMYVKDVHASPVTHYTNSSAQDTIPTSLPGFILNSAENAALINASVFPQRQVLITPSVTYSMPLPVACTGTISFGVPVTLYTDKYVWMNIDDAKSALAFQANRIAVYNMQDGHYYWYDEPIEHSPVSFTEVFSATPLSWEEKRRTDVSIDVALSVKHAVWTLGTVALNAEISKNFSTLRKEKFLGMQLRGAEAPFSIPDWSWSLGLLWNYNFSAY
jgi:hypothetical protein